MSERPVQVALREMQTFLRDRRVVAGLVAVVLVLALAGGFGTGGFMRLAPRVAYWAVLVPLTAATGAFMGAWLSRVAPGGRRTAWLLTGLGTGLVITLEVTALNWAVFGVTPLDAAYLRGLVINVFAVAFVIVLALMFVYAQTPDAPDAPDAPEAPDTPETSAAPAAAEAPPPLLRRLPLARRGALVSLSVQDHYVEVTTTGGAELLLLRLSDAIAETAPTPGLQVHRSHWVALEQVADARREGNRAVLTLTDGREIPVSRSYLPAARQAGLLP